MTLRHLSIRLKVIFITVACTVLALSIASVGLLYYDLTSFKKRMTDSLTSEAQVIASNCSAALAFKDPVAVHEFLGSLQAEHQVRMAAVYSSDGKLAASYTREGYSAPIPPQRESIPGSSFEGDKLSVVLDVRSGKDKVGYLVIEEGMSDWYERRNRLAQVMGILVILCAGVSLAVGSRLERVVSAPIKDLAGAMRSVAINEQYDARVTKSGNDEIGDLTDGFNSMLAEIEKRDRDLHAANCDLEERVRGRTAQLESEIAERKLAEELLVTSQRSLADFFENATVGLHWLGPDGTVLRVNRAELDMLGYTAEEYLGHSIADFHEDKEVIEDILARLARRETLTSYEARMRCKNGQIKHVAIESNVLWEEDKFVHTRCFTRDLTAQKAALRAEQAREEAERANQAKSEFLSRMSHELRTPMNAILGFSQLLQLEESLTSSQQDSVIQIRSAGSHLLKLINEVLDISRIEAGNIAFSMEAVSLGEVLDEVVALVQPMATQRRITVSKPSGEPTPYVLADQQRLYQILLNLLSNAVKYNVEGGAIDIAVETGESNVRLLVTDTGPGIPPEKQHRLFIPFDRLGVEQAGIDGTGLGLALSRHLAEAMGGTIGLLPSARGACFHLDLARGENPLAALDGLVTDAPVIAFASSDDFTVLLVEDNLANVHLMEAILARRPHCKLIVAMQGSIALDLARKHHPSLILLDLNLPDMDGAIVLAQLREGSQTADIPVAVVSADVNPGRIEKLMKAGAVQYMTKPLDVQVLLSLLDGFQPTELKLAS